MSKRRDRFDEFRHLITSMSNQIASMDTRIRQFNNRWDKWETRTHSPRTHNHTKQAAPLCVAPKRFVKEECTKSKQIDQEAIQDLPKMAPRSIPEASSCVTLQGVVSAVQEEEPTLLLVSKEEEGDHQPKDDSSAANRHVLEKPQSMEPPPVLPLIHGNEHQIGFVFISNYIHQHVIPKTLQVQWIQERIRIIIDPRDLGSPRLFPEIFFQGGESKLASRRREPIRILQNINVDTNKFDFFAAYQVSTSVNADNSTMLNNEVTTYTMWEEPFREGGNDEDISSPIGLIKHPTRVKARLISSTATRRHSLKRRARNELDNSIRDLVFFN